MPSDDHGGDHGDHGGHGGGGGIPTFERFMTSVFGIVEAPVRIFRGAVVEPIQSRNKDKLFYYHRRYRRVPTIDECEVTDVLCKFEAQEQFRRDKHVDDEILSILRQRRLECEHYHGRIDAIKYCQKVKEDYLTAEGNWFTKYGDVGPTMNAKTAYMKQKHRLLWERRHGPVGTGMRGVSAH